MLVSFREYTIQHIIFVVAGSLSQLEQWKIKLIVDKFIVREHKSRFVNNIHANKHKLSYTCKPSYKMAEIVKGPSVDKFCNTVIGNPVSEQVRSNT